MANSKLEVRLPYSEEMPVALIDLLAAMAIPCRFLAENGSGALLVTIGEAEDAELLRLWDCLTDVRVRYMEARQELVAAQLSFLPSGEEAVIL